ncbi:17121_t:CDS:10, partial [Acaulospora morrowiae]
TNIRLLPPPTEPAQQTQEHEIPKSQPAHMSRVTTTKFTLPSHADIREFANGGVLMGWIDLVAGISARKHSMHPCVTKCFDAVHFMNPVLVGDVVLLQASVNRAWNTSMEVGVRVETENPITGKRRYCCHAYLTFVALAPTSTQVSGASAYQNVKASVPQLIPNTPIEMQRYELAEQRRQARLAHFLHEDEHGRREQTRLAEIRNIMRTWSELSNVEKKSNAEVPPLLQEPDAYDEDKNDGNDENDPAKLYLNRRRSIYRDSLLVQPDQRFISESFAEVMEVILPQHANTLQITFGGQIIEWMEQSARISALRHSRKFVLSASIDSLQFIKPTYVGYSITVRSIVSCTFHSSMEIYCFVEARNSLTGEKFFTNDGFFTMVAVDFNNIPVRVPRVVPENEQEEQLFAGAEVRRTRRLQQRRELVQKELSTHPEEFVQFSNVT